MKPRTVLVLGAGFSKPAGGPLLRELFDPAYLECSSANPEVISALGELAAKSQDTQSIEELFTQIWREAKTAGSLRLGANVLPAEQVWRQLAIHLTSVCGPIKLRRRSHRWETFVTYLDMLHQTSKSLDVVTFNYDLLVEQLLDGLDLRYDYGDVRDLLILDSNRRRNLTRSGADVHVLKVHGSANWGFCPGCDKADSTEGLMVAYETPYVPVRRQSCPYCNRRMLEPGIVPPVHGKAGETKNMGEVWKHARRVLSRADEVLVVGYSLPAADHEAVSLLREATKAQVTVVCGPNGAPPTYAQLFPNLTDARAYVEEFFQPVEE